MDTQQDLQKAVEHHRAGRLREAEAIYRTLLASDPRHADVLNLLATMQRQRGELAAAIDLARRAIAARPNVADFHFNLAEGLRASGNLEEAIGSYVECLRINPRDAEAERGLAIVYARLGRHEQAASHFRRAIGIRWNFAEAHEDLATSLAALGESEQAIEACRKALNMFPRRAQSHLRYAAILATRGEWSAAGAAYAKAAELAPNLAAAYLGMAQASNRLGRRDMAEQYARKTLSLEPGNAAAHNHLGLALAAQSRLGGAADAFREAIRLTPDAPEGHGNLAGVMLQCRDHAQGVSLYRRAAELALQSAMDHSNLLLSMNYPQEITAPALFAEHVRWAALHAERLAHLPPRAPPDAGKRLRIGYVSPDLREHPVSYFIEPVLQSHDKERFDVFVYNDVSQPDSATARLRALSPTWRDVFGLSDQRLAETIRSDAIDVLIDLAGHTAGSRLLLFARRPAPVQVSYLGYPNTTGLPERVMQFRLTDEICDSPGESDALHTERLARLPACFLCYKPPASSPEVAPAPSDSRGHITFGSFSSMPKITPQAVACWSAILKGVPSARFLLKNKSLADDGAWNRLLADFSACGISADRIVRGKSTRSHEQHLTDYAQIDIALDTFPYNGTTTICEALWMGVPTITLAGNVHRARVGASLLSQIGLTDLVARSPGAYVDAAVSLANDPRRLLTYRNELRERMVGSPLMDRLSFVHSFENCLARMCTS